MTGITQMVLTGQSEPIVGYKGQLSNSNSLIFGEGATTALQPGDASLMSSLTMGGLPAFSNNAFTIEAWIKFNNLQFNEQIVHQNGQAIIGSSSLSGSFTLLLISNAVYIQNYLIVNNAFNIPSQAVPSQSWQLANWYHIALSRSISGQFTMWVNGYRTPTGIVSNTVNYNLVATMLGNWRSTYGYGTTNNFIGSMYNLRIVQGTTVYNPTDSTISIPTGPLGIYGSQTKLLLRSLTGQSPNDQSGVTIISPRAGSVTQSLSTPFNDTPTLNGALNNLSSPFSTPQSGSLILRGIYNYATYPGNSGMAFGTDDFTIEWFSYANYSLSHNCPWWYGDTSTPALGILFEISGSNTIIKLYYQSSNITLATISTASYYRNWTHWALVRIGGVLYFYKDATLLNPGGTSHVVNYTDSISILYLGKRGNLAAYNEAFQGYLTNLRIIKGLGVYTNGFTRPTGNLLRTHFANPYGGSNTAAVRTDQVTYLLVP